MFALLLVVTVAARLPEYVGPRVDPLMPLGGASLVNGTEWTRLCFATEAIGTYQHGANIAYLDGMVIVTWKNSPRDEDQPGQRVLYSQTLDGKTWTKCTGDNILFPNVSTALNLAHLNAQEMPIIDDERLYAIATVNLTSLQFDSYNLFPVVHDIIQLVLMRRIFTNATDTFGPIFWASASIPSSYEPISKQLGLRMLAEMDPQSQSDAARLTNLTSLPCPSTLTGSFKCEGCMGGCQNLTQVLANCSQCEDERTHLKMANSSYEAILYRSRSKRLVASVRASPSEEWSVPEQTNITDDQSNLNAGRLPDGRVYLVHNHMLNIFRDPLFVITSPDGWSFDQIDVVASCSQSIFKSPDQPSGCLYRHQGGSKEGGAQYPQALSLSAPAPESLRAFWVAFSLNKEDIWIAKIPLANF